MNSTLILLLLIGAGFCAQYLLDLRLIRAWASERGWSTPAVRWAPFAPKSFRDSRWTRSYAVRLRDASGAWREGHCHVCNLIFGSASDVLFDETAPRGSARRGPAPLLGRPAWLLAGGAIGSFLGAGVGILGSFVLYPTSNIAPAYGLLMLGPLGLIAGLAFGATKRI